MKNEPNTRELLSGPRDMMFVMGAGDKILSVEYTETDKGSCVKVSEDGEVDYEAMSKDKDTIVTQFVTIALEKMKNNLPQLQEAVPQGPPQVDSIPAQFRAPP